MVRFQHNFSVSHEFKNAEAANFTYSAYAFSFLDVQESFIFESAQGRSHFNEHT